MDHDDEPVGRLLTRREVLALIAMSGAGVLMGRSAVARAAAGAATAVPSCVVRPQQTEGPYFVDEMLNRSDIRTDPKTGVARAGAALALAFRVSQLVDGKCAPHEGAQVDVWHCDAQGIYSDVEDPSFDTTGQKFLRGSQRTDAGGMARFTTIYPGWYGGHTVHIHFKIRTQPESARGHEFTSQLYFDDALTDRVHTLAPYASKGQRRLRNERDGLFRRGGDQLMLAPTLVGKRYAATFDVALQLG